MDIFKKITVSNDHKQHSNPDWESQGVLHLKAFIPDDLIDGYIKERKQHLEGTNRWLPGWPNPDPHLKIGSIRALSMYRPLTQTIAKIIGEEPGLHLSLTGFQSTERAWHQDRYLNPEGVGERYIAAWIALDDIHSDSGPFEFVPGSHLWPVIERTRVWDHMRELGQEVVRQTWPSDSQGWVAKACETEIVKRGATVSSFVAKKGDVLLWHASLLHRGSLPKNRKLERRSLICHYSAISARADMRPPIQLENGSFIFPSFQFQVLDKLRRFF